MTKWPLFHVFGLQDLKWRPDSVCVIHRADDERAAQASGCMADNPVEVMLVCFPADGPRHQVMSLLSIRPHSNSDCVP
jgi:hypothetical protein